jgi:hypothetical protein
MTKNTYRIWGLVACGFFLAVFGTMAWTAVLGKSATWDEGDHLIAAWTQVHFDDFRLDPSAPSLWRYWAVIGTSAGEMNIDRSGPVWNNQVGNIILQDPFSQETLYRTFGNDADALLRAGRSRMLVVGIVLGIIVAWWSWQLGGALAGVVAMAGFCLDPNFLAHAPLVKNDVSETLTLFAFLITVWLLGEKATLLRWMLAAIFLGAAIATKQSGILGVPMLGIALLFRAMLKQPWRVFRRNLKSRWEKALGAIAISLAMAPVIWLIIWACYSFRFAPTPDGKLFFNMPELTKLANMTDAFSAHGAPLQVNNEEFSGWIDQWKPSLMVRAINWANDYRLLPHTFLAQFLFGYATTRIRIAYLLGSMSKRGWWYYFPLAILFKTPLATLCAMGIALPTAFWLWRRKSQEGRNYWPLIVAVTGPAIYLTTAMLEHINLGIRHALPVYPFIYVGLGVTAAAAWRLRPKLTGAICVILLIGLSAETLAAYPNFIPFFNVAVGGSRGGLKLLSDSNIDWGQELIDLANWQKQHPDCRLSLCYYGAADSRYYQIHYVNLPGSTAPEDETAAAQIASGKGRAVWAISACSLQAIPGSGQVSYYYLRDRRPIAVLGGSLYLFDQPDQ